MVGLAARRLMKQARSIVMENTRLSRIAGATPEPLADGVRRGEDDRQYRIGAMLAEGFATLLAAEDTAKPPVAHHIIGADGIAYETGGVR